MGCHRYHIHSLALDPVTYGVLGQFYEVLRYVNNKYSNHLIDC